jgi:histidinol-phosphate aminotransferase
MMAIPESASARLTDYTEPELRDFGARIRAHRNESAFPMPAAVLAAVRSLDAGDLRRYPADRYEQLARLAGAKLGADPGSMIFASGSDDLILAAVLAFGGSGTNAVIPRPAFGMYRRAARLHGCEVREVPYATRWRLDPAALLAACDADTRLIFLGNPNNPTGDALEPETLAAIAAGVPNALIVVDEAYLTGRDGSAFPQVAQRDNLAAIGTLSKVPGLAGLRCGFGAAAPGVARAIRRVMQPHPLTVPALSAMQAYFESVFDDPAYVESYRAFVARSLTRMAEAFGPYAKRTSLGGCNFVLFEFGAQAQRIADALQERGILVRRLEAPEFDGAIRINALDDADTGELIRELTAILEPIYA